ncbi:insulin-like growth factor binding proteinn-terminal [Anaeramoeba ignava]|uniref:Insulin-like growth factor binding proteinn-terminal n=1 Tax=Anaeramoeba ignava TaxID=1746090 RepID=A0A9Q0LI70_ANAIG|nr:insulin-like growth factor binding proteinn-terminal [Anaeramoeba ignava]
MLLKSLLLFLFFNLLILFTTSNYNVVYFCPLNFTWSAIQSNSEVHLRTCCIAITTYTILSGEANLNNVENVTFYGELPAPLDLLCNLLSHTLSFSLSSQLTIQNSRNIVFNATGFEFDFTDMKTQIISSEVYFYGTIKFLHPLLTKKNIPTLLNPCPAFTLTDSSFVHLEDSDFTNIGNCWTTTSQPLFSVTDSEIETVSVSHVSDLFLSMQNPSATKLNSSLIIPSNNPSSMSIIINNPRLLSLEDKNNISIHSQVPISLILTGDLVSIDSNFSSISINNGSLEIDNFDSSYASTVNVYGDSLIFGEGNFPITHLYLHDNSNLSSNIPLSINQFFGSQSESNFTIQKSIDISSLYTSSNLSIWIQNSNFSVSSIDQPYLISQVFLDNAYFQFENSVSIQNVQVTGDQSGFIHGSFQISEIDVQSQLFLQDANLDIQGIVQDSIDSLLLFDNSQIKFSLSKNISINNITCQNDCEIYSINWVLINNLVSNSKVYFQGYFESIYLINSSIIEFENSTFHINSESLIVSPSDLTFIVSETILYLKTPQLTTSYFYSKNSQIYGSITNSIQISDSFLTDQDQFYETHFIVNTPNFGSFQSNNSQSFFINSNVDFQHPISSNLSLSFQNSTINATEIAIPSSIWISFEDCLENIDLDLIHLEGSLELINSSLLIEIESLSQIENFLIQNARLSLKNSQENYYSLVSKIENSSISNIHLTSNIFNISGFLDLQNSSLSLLDGDSTHFESQSIQIFGDHLSTIEVLSGGIEGCFDLELNSINLSFSGSCFQVFEGGKVTISNYSLIYFNQSTTNITFDDLSIQDSIFESENEISVNNLDIFNDCQIIIPHILIYSNFDFQNYQIQNLFITFYENVTMNFNFSTIILNSTFNNFGKMQFGSGITFENAEINNQGELGFLNNISKNGFFTVNNYGTFYFISLPQNLTYQNSKLQESIPFIFEGDIYNEKNIYLNGFLLINGSLTQNQSGSAIYLQQNDTMELDNFNLFGGSIIGDNLQSLQVKNSFICTNGEIISINLIYSNAIFSTGNISFLDSQILSDSTLLIDASIQMNNSQITISSNFEISNSSASIQGNDGFSSIINNGNFTSLSGIIQTNIINNLYLHFENSDIYFESLKNFGTFYLGGSASITNNFENYGNAIFSNLKSSKLISFQEMKNFGEFNIIGSFTFSGNFLSSENSSFQVEIQKGNETEIRFNSGSVYLTGLLDVYFSFNLFQPKLGDEFPIMIFEGILDNNFSTLELNDLSKKFEINVTNEEIKYIFMGCESGYFSSDLYSECQACSQGSFSSKRASFYCESCSLGSYANKTGSPKCSLCESGSFSASIGSISCEVCPIGTYSSQNGSESCSICPQGYYSNTNGSSSCKKCGIGRETTSSSTCEYCKVGTYNRKEASPCLVCPAGSYSSSNGATFCFPCGMFYYQDEMGQSTCKRCPSNTITFSQGSSTINECVCKEGMYGNPGEDCKSCPKGGICNEPGMNEPKVDQGYWADQNLIFYKCDPFEACPGGNKETCNSKLGYQGVICSECSKGYYKFSSRCQKCPTNSKKRLYIAGIILVLFAILLVIIARSKARSYFGSLSIALSFFQILATLPKMQVSWPSRTQSFLNSLSFFNFNIDFLAPECSLSISFTIKWFSVVLVPVVIVILFAFLFLVIQLHSIIIRKCGSKFSEKFPNFCAKPTRRTTNKYLYPFSWIRFQISKFFTHGNSSAEKLYSSFLNAFVAFCFLAYLFLCQWIFTLFSCTKQANGVYTLNAAPSYRCYNDPWWKKMVIPGAIFGFLYVIGIPALIIFMLVYHSKYHTEKVFDSRLSLLCSRFRREWFFWELVVMARKAIFVFVLLYFNFIADLQIRLLILILLVAIILQAVFEPYDTKGRNRTELILLSVLEIVMLSSFVFRSNESGDSETKEIVEFIVLILIWIGIVIIFFVFLNEMKERIKYKKNQIKTAEKQKHQDILDVLKGSEFIQLLDRKPSFDFVMEWFGKVSHKKVSKFAKIFNQFNEVIEKNSIQFPEQKYLDNWQELLENEFKDWYEKKANIEEKLDFRSLVYSLLKYINEKNENENENL